jgi:hypothetical protein
VIAEPDSTTTPVVPAAPAASIIETGPLSAAELYRLTLYKWRYSLEAYGFDQAQVRDLMFVKWLFTSRYVLP